MPENQVTVTWLGHSMFLFSLNDTLKVVIDPYDDTVGYPLPDISADIVLVSHRHFDHDNVKLVKGKPKVVDSDGVTSLKGITFKGVPSVHDDKDGTLRGLNTIFVWEMGGIRFAHLGDLGVMLTTDQIKQIGQIDVLFPPVGGYFTIDAATSTKIIEELKPKVVFPMHYKTEVMGDSFPIAGINDLISGKKNVKRVGKNSITLNKDELPEETTIYVLNYK
jgi:L-ascorbate metabolism protein UlaG (beta-lactamase superfamily)